MSTLNRNESIECVVSPLPSGMLLVTTKLVVTTPRAGRRELALYASARFADFTYDAASSYLAKRVRNAIAGATTDPDLF